MKIKNVLSRAQLENLSKNILDELDQDLIFDLFLDELGDTDKVITFDELDFASFDDLVDALADVLGNTPCEESD